MRSFSGFLIFSISVASIFGATTDRFQNVDLDAILSNDRLLNNYIKCFLETGPCTSQASDLKKVIPHTLETLCNDCGEGEKEFIRKSINFMLEHRPNDWKEIKAHLDPNNELMDDFMKIVGVDYVK